MPEALLDNSDAGRIKRIARMLAASPGDLEETAHVLALREGVPVQELAQFIDDHYAEIQTQGARARADGQTIKPLADTILHDGLTRLVQALPEAELAELLEIIKVAKNVKEAEVRAELAQDDTEKLPIFNFIIHHDGSRSMDVTPAGEQVEPLPLVEVVSTGTGATSMGAIRPLIIDVEPLPLGDDDE